MDKSRTRVDWGWTKGKGLVGLRHLAPLSADRAEGKWAPT